MRYAALALCCFSALWRGAVRDALRGMVYRNAFFVALCLICLFPCCCGRPAAMPVLVATARHKAVCVVPSSRGPIQLRAVYGVSFYVGVHRARFGGRNVAFPRAETQGTVAEDLPRFGMLPKFMRITVLLFYALRRCALIGALHFDFASAPRGFMSGAWPPRAPRREAPSPGTRSNVTQCFSIFCWSHAQAIV